MIKINQIVKFVKHLRLHYQFLLLSGAYLLGGAFSSNENWIMFIIQYLNVHILLFGGLTAYNSFWDKDKGPIGGLKNPPKIENWMHNASLGLQIAGLIIALFVNYYFASLYFLVMVLSIFYSHPKIRWKGKPLLSFIPVGLGTGLLSFYMGYLAFGAGKLDYFTFLAGIGTTLIIISMYPISQVYQIKQDKNKNIRTFANYYGLEKVRRLFIFAYSAGLIMVAISLLNFSYILSVLTIILGLPVMFFANRKLKKVKGNKKEYSAIMKIKYFTSLALTLFVLLILVLRNLKAI